MNSKEFKIALDNIVKEKNIDPEVIYGAMETALTSAYKKNFNSKTNVKVIFNRDTGDIKVYSYLTVVPDDKLTKEEYEEKRFEEYATNEDIDTKEEAEEEEKAFQEEVKKAEEAGLEPPKKDKNKSIYFNPETEIKLSEAKKI